jgi:hypothetical protein
MEAFPTLTILLAVDDAPFPRESVFEKPAAVGPAKYPNDEL